MTLKREVMRLAYENPELRPHLLPLLKVAFSEGKIPKGGVKTEITTEVIFGISHDKANILKERRNQHGLIEALVQAPATIVFGGEKTQFKVSYWVVKFPKNQYSPEKLGLDVYSWASTTLPKFLEEVFEQALRTSGVSTVVGSKLFH